MHSATYLTFAGFHMSREQADKLYCGVSYKMSMLGHLDGFRRPPRNSARDPKPLLLERLSHLLDGSELPTRERSARGARKSALRLIGRRTVRFEREYREQTPPQERDYEAQKAYVKERADADFEYQLALSVIYPEDED